MGDLHQQTHTPIDEMIVAERVLKRFDNDEPLHVKVWAPIPAPEMGPNCNKCFCEITGLDQPFHERAIGADSLQALQLVFQCIHNALRTSKLPIGFSGATPGHTGFERFHEEPIMDSLFENLSLLEIIRQNLLFQTLSPRSGPHQTKLENTTGPLREIERLRHLIQAKIVSTNEEAIAGFFRSAIVPLRLKAPQSRVFGSCIAKRSLTRHDTGGAVQIEVWKPVCGPPKEKEPWTCGYKITGLDDPTDCAVEGQDSIEALRFAFEAIRMDLKESKLPLGFPETTEPPGHTGLERFDDDRFQDELTVHLIEAEVTRHKILRDSLDANASSSENQAALLDHTQQAELLRQHILQKIVERKRATNLP